MADILDIESYKKRKLAKAEADWLEFMDRAEEFQRMGNHKFAAEMLARAKAARSHIAKLRTPTASNPLPFGNHDDALAKMTNTYDEMDPSK